MLEPNGKVKRLNGKEVHDWDTHDQSRKALMEAKEKAVRGDLQSEQNLLGLVLRWQGPFEEHTPKSKRQKVMASQVIDVYYTAQKAAARDFIACCVCTRACCVTLCSARVIIYHTCDRT